MGLANGCLRVGKTEETKAAEESSMIRNGGLLLSESIAWFNGRRNPIRNFSAEEIKNATNNYDPSQIFSRDAFHELYVGRLQGFPICVKKYIEHAQLKKYIEDAQLKMRNTVPFTDAVVSSRMSSHNNALKLLGCCLETQMPALVFEFAENGTLADCLYGSRRRALSWKCRLRIAADIANAIVYLHTAFARPIVHRDIKPSKILLNQCNVAKLSGFCLCISIPEGESHAADVVAGTYNFLAPEYIQRGLVNEKADVFAFGKCLLVLLTGQSENQPDSSRFKSDDVWRSSMSDFVEDHMKNDRFEEIVDAAILGEEGWPGREQQLRDFAELALCCIVEEEEDRPLMTDVAKRLRHLEQSTSALL